MNTADKFKRYTRSFGIALTAVVTLIVMFNGVIDPKALTNWVTIPGINAVKSTLQPYSRTAKSLALTDCEYDFVFVGTSRTNIGMNPDYAGFGGRPVFNAGALNANIIEQERIAAYVIEQQQPEAIFLGLDFLAFLNETPTAFDFRFSRYAGDTELRLLPEYLLSRNTLTASVSTVLQNRGRQLEPCSDNGMDDRRQVPVPHRSAFDKMLRRFVTRYTIVDYAPDRVPALGKILRNAADNGVTVHIAMMPMHALQLEMLDAVDVADSYFQWRRDVVAEVEAVNADLTAERQFPLWDFADYNSITTEPVPDDDETPMQWYRESSHFRAVTGELMLDRMLGLQQAGAELPDDFGTPLTASSLAAQEATWNEQRAAYTAREQQEIDKLRAMAEEELAALALRNRNSGQAPPLF